MKMKMRNGFTLIELIITIVIMAGVFAVIPKIMFATGKSDAFALRQDALFEALSLTKIASKLAWDENNTDHLDILQTQSSYFECNTSTKLRHGSYISSNGRVCAQPLYASLPLGADTGESDYLDFDDIDDFDGSEVNASVITPSGFAQKKYRLSNSVVYLTDAVTQDNGTVMKIDLSLSSISPTTTNIKKFTSKVRYVGSRGKERNISTFFYYSTNIGQISLAYRNW